MGRAEAEYQKRSLELHTHATPSKGCKRPALVRPPTCKQVLTNGSTLLLFVLTLAQKDLAIRALLVNAGPYKQNNLAVKAQTSNWAFEETRTREQATRATSTGQLALDATAPTHTNQSSPKWSSKLNKRDAQRRHNSSLVPQFGPFIS